MKSIFKLGLLSLSVMFYNTSVFACGKVTLSDMNWSSATLIAHVDQFILTNGYGCDAQLVPGDTQPTGASMLSKGQPDIASEMWSNAMKDAFEKGVQEKQLRIVGKALSDGGEEGFWVPEYMVKKYPEMATIKGVIAHAKLFPNHEDPDHFAFYGCPAGWNCQISADNLFAALNLDKAGFKVIDPGSGAALAGSITKAYERKQAWFGYYWAPTAILGKYKMVKVDFESGVDEKAFVGCITKEDCNDPKVTMYPPSPVQTIMTEKAASKNPEIVSYLSARSFKNTQMNELLAWMEDNQADGDIAMEHFLKTNKDVWTKWVSKPVADKVNKALSEL